MRAPLTDRQDRLASGSLRVLASLAGWQLRCVEGRVWLTEAVRGEDITLQAGDTYCVRGDGKLLIEAASDAPARLHWQAPIAGAASRVAEEGIEA